MITLTTGGVQNASNIFVPNGNIELQLNVDATVIASPYGLVMADIPIVFQLDSSGNLSGTCQIWSNAELNPQNSIGLGTYYLVTIYDQNGARLNKVPMWWQFTQSAGSTVDISQMTAFSTVGGNVIYYPVDIFIPTPGPSTLGGIYSNAGVTSKWVSAINTDGTVTLTQPSFSDILGTLTTDQLPSPLSFDAITVTGLITAEANIQLGVAGTTSGQITFEGSTSGSATITAPATAGTSTNPFSFSNSINIPSGTVFSINTDTGISRASAGVIDIGNGTAGNATGKVNAAQYNVAGSQISASNLSNGVSGTGAILLAASPTSTGTFTAAIISATSLEKLTGQLTPNAAGGIAVGTTALPFASIWIGSASGTNANIVGTFTGNRVWTIQDSTDVFVGRNTTDTLTNKTISGELTLVSATFGLGNSTSANLTALGLGTGSGPASDVVAEWMEVTINSGTYWIPLFQ